MKVLKTIWRDIRQGENIDSYVAIIAALSLSILSISGFANQGLLASVTLAVLALLAITNLGNRHRLDAVLNSNSDDILMQKNPETLQADLERAKELWLFGYNLTRTIVNYSTLIDEKLEHGGKVKVLVLDPSGEALLFATQTLYYPMTVDQHRERINASLANLREIAKSKKSSVEVRLIDYPLAFGINAMDISASNGRIYIKTYEYKSKTQGPHLLFSPRDEYWYDYYKGQLLALWNDAKPYDL